MLSHIITSDVELSASNKPNNSDRLQPRHATPATPVAASTCIRPCRRPHMTELNPCRGGVGWGGGQVCVVEGGEMSGMLVGLFLLWEVQGSYLHMISRMTDVLLGFSQLRCPGLHLRVACVMQFELWWMQCCALAVLLTAHPVLHCCQHCSEPPPPASPVRSLTSAATALWLSAPPAAPSSSSSTMQGRRRSPAAAVAAAKAEAAATAWAQATSAETTGVTEHKPQLQLSTCH